VVKAGGVFRRFNQSTTRDLNFIVARQDVKEYCPATQYFAEDGGIPQGQHHTEARRSHDRRPHQVRSGPRAYQPLNTFPIARSHLVQPRSQPSDLLIARL